MPICVVVHEKKEVAGKLAATLKNGQSTLLKCDLIRPSELLMESKKSLPSKSVQEVQGDINSFPLDAIPLLNPTISRKSRQKSMAFWLVPFGLISGWTFTAMTGLQTFSKLGIDFLPETISGGLIGMLSGWIGSFVAASSVNPDKNGDLQTLKKLNEEGFWLLLIETPIEIDLPWQTIQDSVPSQIVRLRDQ